MTPDLLPPNDPDHLPGPPQQLAPRNQNAAPVSWTSPFTGAGLPGTSLPSTVPLRWQIGPSHL